VTRGGSMLRLTWIALSVAAALLLALGWVRFANDIERAPRQLSIDAAFVAGGSFAPAPMTADAAAVPTRWRTVELPYQIDAVPGVGTQIGTLWVRPAVPQVASPKGLYLYVPRWQAIGHLAVYADRRQIYAPESGPVWASSNQPVWLKLANAGEAPPRELLVRIVSSATYPVAISTIRVGPGNQLGPIHRVRQFVQIDAPQFGAAVLLVTGMATGLVWLRRRRESAYLLIFGQSVMSYLHAREYLIGDEAIWLPDGIFQWMEVNTKAWALTFALMLLGRLFEVRHPRLERGVLLFSVIYSVTTLAWVCSDFAGNIMLPRSLLWPAPIALSTIVIWVAWKAWRAVPDGKRLAFAVIASLQLAAGLFDQLLYGSPAYIENVLLLPIVMIVQMALFFYIIVNRHVIGLDTAARAKIELQERLQMREAELAVTHHRLIETERANTLVQERERLMRDLHDGLGSSLMGALVAVEHGRLGDDETANLLRSCIDDLKLVIDSLEPSETNLLLMLATVRYRLPPRPASPSPRRSSTWRSG